ncbi:hypothetical protein JG688_00011565 [Phytophthora aleatoria]|uniref:Uncharacterized protein n=1 Tax=Phytophthora aleatoria TaxID=2496075 RepID=A0A8J5M569_9STRA|nr:hypothetical protein JG688_00011565 [Phytophthora aleatoria]
MPFKPPSSNQASICGVASGEPSGRLERLHSPNYWASRRRTNSADAKSLRGRDAREVREANLVQRFQVYCLAQEHSQGGFNRIRATMYVIDLYEDKLGFTYYRNSVNGKLAKDLVMNTVELQCLSIHQVQVLSRVPLDTGCMISAAPTILNRTTRFGFLTSKLIRMKLTNFL